MFNIYCDQFDFSSISVAMANEVESDCPLAVEIVIADEQEIQRLNREMRSIDSVTDVLSFPSLDDIKGVTLKKADFPADIDEEGNLFLGSIAICEKRAREQAEEYGHSFKREMFYLAVHGVCHLLGYDHMTEEDKAEMREKEERILTAINVTRDGE